jgi:hypothetical protein
MNPSDSPADIFDELEAIVPAEHREAFLRASRDLRELATDNPELLRLVEVIGLTSLYTHTLPTRIGAAIKEQLAAFNSHPDASGRDPDPDPGQAGHINDALGQFTRTLERMRRRSVFAIACIGAALILAIATLAGWVVYQEHAGIESRVQRRVNIATRDAQHRLQLDGALIRALLALGIEGSIEADERFRPSLVITGRSGVSRVRGATFRDGAVHISIDRIDD